MKAVRLKERASGDRTRRQQRGLLLAALLPLMALLLVRCGLGARDVTPTPTKTRVALSLATNTPVPTLTWTPAASAEASPIIPALSPSPLPLTDTPPPPTATQPPPTATEVPTSPPPTNTVTSPTPIEPTSPPPPTATPVPANRPPLPPQKGGEWDMEGGFVPGVSPLGEDCPGWAVAVGWKAFLAPGMPASSCFNENKNPANVKSGERSQEITFDFISAEAGIWRHAQTIPGHDYQIEAWGKHVRSASPVELSLGVDLTGGEDWQAATVTWLPWDEAAEETWVHTRVTVRTRGETLTVFLKGYHPYAAQGGATLFDDVRVVDLGP